MCYQELNSLLLGLYRINKRIGGYNSIIQMKVLDSIIPVRCMSFYVYLKLYTRSPKAERSDRAND